MSELLTLRIPISDGPDGRVGYMYFTELADPPGSWRLSLKERDEHDAMRGPDRQCGIDALASALEAFGNTRIETYERMKSILASVAESRPGFRGNYRQKVMTMENVRFHKSRNMLVTTCAQVGKRLQLFNWPVPGERVLNDGTVLRFKDSDHDTSTTNPTS